MDFLINISSDRWYLCDFLLQLKMIHMMGRESVKPYGQSSVFLIKRVAIYMIFTTEGRRYRKSYMSFAWNKVMQTAI